MGTKVLMHSIRMKSHPFTTRRNRTLQHPRLGDFASPFGNQQTKHCHHHSNTRVVSLRLHTAPHVFLLHCSVCIVFLAKFIPIHASFIPDPPLAFSRGRQRAETQSPTHNATGQVRKHAHQMGSKTSQEANARQVHLQPDNRGPAAGCPNRTPSRSRWPQSSSITPMCPQPPHSDSHHLFEEHLA